MDMEIDVTSIVRVSLAVGTGMVVISGVQRTIGALSCIICGGLAIIEGRLVVCGSAFACDLGHS